MEVAAIRGLIERYGWRRLAAFTSNERRKGQLYVNARQLVI